MYHYPKYNFTHNVKRLAQGIPRINLNTLQKQIKARRHISKKAFEKHGKCRNAVKQTFPPFFIMFYTNYQRLKSLDELHVYCVQVFHLAESEICSCGKDLIMAPSFNKKKNSSKTKNEIPQTD